MNRKKGKKNSSFLSKVLYASGTVALIFMLSFSTVNFLKDARVLKSPVLSSAAAADKGTESSESDEYKTIKYQKPTATPKPKSKKTPVPQKTATPTPKVIPSSDP